MPRSIWSGAISFGLVNVPVKLYSAVSRKNVRFHQLDETTGARIQMKRVSSKSGKEVPYEQIVKGYELTPDRYVMIDSDELESLDPKRTRTIDIVEFVDLADIDPIFYDHPYYLAPDKGAQKPYKLLVKAMEAAGKVAIARVVIRSKESLTAIRANDGVLVMSTMLFADEVVSPDGIDELPDSDVKATKREIEMAQQLIKSLSSDFEPGKFHDEYRERVLDLIERKSQGEEIVVAEQPEEPTKVPDLMAALEASLQAAKKTGPAKAAANGASKARGRAKAPKPGAKSKAGSSNGAKRSSSSKAARGRKKASSKSR